MNHIDYLNNQKQRMYTLKAQPGADHVDYANYLVAAAQFWAATGDFHAALCNQMGAADMYVTDMTQSIP